MGMQLSYTLMNSLISRSDRALEHIIDLRRNAFLSNIAHTDATVSHLDVGIAEH